MQLLKANFHVQHTNKYLNTNDDQGTAGEKQLQAERLTSSWRVKKASREPITTLPNSIHNAALKPFDAPTTSNNAKA